MRIPRFCRILREIRHRAKNVIPKRHWKEKNRGYGRKIKKRDSVKTA
ncbi:conserved hypothetical protein [delta proteobacterium NaphS2]|nr:conserved hypothetical protein [delta proteobacterium NaphS2]